MIYLRPFRPSFSSLNCVTQSGLTESLQSERLISQAALYAQGGQG